MGQAYGKIVGDNLRVSKSLSLFFSQEMTKWFDRNKKRLPNENIYYLITIHRFPDSKDYLCEIEVVERWRVWSGSQRGQDPFHAFSKSLELLSPMRIALVA